MAKGKGHPEDNRYGGGGRPGDGQSLPGCHTLSFRQINRNALERINEDEHRDKNGKVFRKRGHGDSYIQ